MPKGVEHPFSVTVSPCFRPVRRYEMPQGVEHWTNGGQTRMQW